MKLIFVLFSDIFLFQLCHSNHLHLNFPTLRQKNRETQKNVQRRVWALRRQTLQEGDHNCPATFNAWQANGSKGLSRTSTYWISRNCKLCQDWCASSQPADYATHLLYHFWKRLQRHHQHYKIWNPLPTLEQKRNYQNYRSFWAIGWAQLLQKSRNSRNGWTRNDRTLVLLKPRAFIQRTLWYWKV